MCTGHFEETVLAWRSVSKGLHGWVVDFGSRKPRRFRDETLLLEKVSDVHTSLIVHQRALELGVSSHGKFLCQHNPSGLDAPRRVNKVPREVDRIAPGTVVYVQRKGGHGVAHPLGLWWDCRLLAFHSRPWPSS